MTPINTNNTAKSFLTSLLIISATIASAELLIMILLEELPKWGINLTPLQDIMADTTLLTLLVAPTIWFLSLRPLSRKVDEQQAQNTHQANENQQLRNALDTFSLVSIVDVEKRITYVNPLFCDISGYSESELVGKTHRLVNSGEHDPAFFNALWQTISQGQPWHGEICDRNKQGELYWSASTIFPMLDKSGKTEHYISIGRDITQIKATEANLMTLKRALDASGEMIMVTDEHGYIQHVNPALCDFTGWKNAELLGKPPMVLDSPLADPQTSADMQQGLKRHNAWSGRLLNRRKGAAPFNIAGQTTPPDMRDYWVNVTITAIRNDKSELIGYVQIQRDISAEVEQEQVLLLENTDTLARLAIADILQRDLPLKERFSQVLGNLFNLNANELQRKGGVFLKKPDEDALEMFVTNGPFSEEFIRREQRVPFGACLCGRAAVSQELLVSDDCFCDPRHEFKFEGMKAHGHYIVPIVSAGATLGMMFLYTDPYPVQVESRLNMLQQVGDMMALALLQEQAKLSLETARDAAELSAKTRSEFLANMSHEIRTPMNGVLGMLDILKDTELTTDQTELVDTVANSAESLLTIINDILDISKLEAGKIELEEIPFNLPTLIEEVCALLCNRAHAKKLELACFVPPSIPQIWQGDPTRIRQVLTNLIGNAIKFTEQGEVLVRVKQKKSGDGNELLRFEIKDTGIGMTPEGQAKLFQPFAQADSSTSRRFGGTGLGLSISKSLVDNMHGTIGAESALGEGTCFWFNLPLQPVSTESNADHDTDAKVSLKDKRVLLVDDNATNRKILVHYLQHWGVITHEKDNALDALFELEAAAKRGEAYDMLLSDFHMPNMDGFALARAIKNNPLIADIPRLLLSSGGIDTKADRLELGFAHSLLKPVRQTQLYEAMTNALQVSVKKVAAPAKAITEQADYRGKRILVAEDNVVNQKVIVRMLEKFQCSPDIADNGQVALDKIAAGRYDLVLMDCQMPIMDGYEAVRTLRGLELSQNKHRLPVVALTAHAAAGERDKCLEAGMDDFMTKPIVRAELGKLLARWLGNAEAPEMPETITAPEGVVVVADCWDETAALAYLDDDRDLLFSVMQSYRKETPDKLKQLDAAQAKNDWVAMADVAHGFKSMGGLFCAKPLRNAAIELEQNARERKPVDYQRLTQDLVDSAGQLMVAFADQSVERTEV